MSDTRKPIFSEVRRRWGRLTAAQTEGIGAILDGAARHGLAIHEAAYALATAEHETGRRMVPVRETFAASDKAAAAALERAWKKGQLTWVRRPYWRPDAQGRYWFGRGLAQTTHPDNYGKLDDALGGIGLAEDPSLMLRMDVSVDSLLVGMQRGLFRGRSFDDFAPTDYPAMRQIINGDRRKRDPQDPRVTMGEKIARYARSWERGLRAAYDRGPIQ